MSTQSTWYVVHVPKWLDRSGAVLLLADFVFETYPTATTCTFTTGWPLYSTHFTPCAVELASKNGATILCLPLHTTHAVQPLDLSFIGPLKKHWSSVCHTFMAENPGKVVTKFSFSSLISQAWYKAIKPETIIWFSKSWGVSF